ncbi:MAG TPA: histone deacetylase [Thermohalobaculum sp.]|nr:histone deacetylase [Thermohalobaculum sp.]
MLPVVHHPDYLVPLKPGHRFPMSKYGNLREALLARRLMPAVGAPRPAPASAAQVGLAHDAAYVARVFGQALAPAEVRRIGLPGSAMLARRARLASAGTLLAAWLALEHGLALNAAGGSHHAGPEGGAGYCVFNDVAVAIRNLMAQGVPGPVLVIDADVHQGDGTARVFAAEPGVFTFSIHAERNFPARKARSDLDIALPDGTGDEAYLSALRVGVAQALAASRPRIVFYNAGVDVWAGDRLGRLALTDAGIRARDAQVIAAVRGLGIPLAGVLGGGYDDDPRRLAARHAMLFEEAAAYAALH